SLPDYVTESIFQSERWDNRGGQEMAWDFDVAAGTYEVRLYFAEIHAPGFKNGWRVFDVMIEGATVLDNYDVFADVGANTGVMKSFVVTSDGNLDIDFGHVVQNPAIKAIEVLAVNP
ncbi:MAG: malectin domain-containing carbohydrate-binding protein, partial [Planctomycetota bacterium]